MAITDMLDQTLDILRGMVSQETSDEAKEMLANGSNDIHDKIDVVNFLLASGEISGGGGMVVPTFDLTTNPHTCDLSVDEVYNAAVEGRCPFCKVLMEFTPNIDFLPIYSIDWDGDVGDKPKIIFGKTYNFYDDRMIGETEYIKYSPLGITVEHIAGDYTN